MFNTVSVILILRRSTFSWLKADRQLFPGEEEPKETNWKDRPERKLRLIDDDFLGELRRSMKTSNQATGADLSKNRRDVLGEPISNRQ